MLSVFGEDSELNPPSSLYDGRMVDPSGHPCVDLGRAALSGISAGDRSLERRRQLGDRTLADRAARRRPLEGLDGGDRCPMPARRLSMCRRSAKGRTATASSGR